MTNDENSLVVGQDSEDCLPTESSILNHRLRGDGETFWDAMRKGEAALYGECATTGQPEIR